MRIATVCARTAIVKTMLVISPDSARKRVRVYFIATDPRFEPKLRQILAPLGPVDNLRVLLVGRDDLDAIPGSAPTFVMSSASEYLARRYGPHGGPGRAIHAPRSFSDSTARELLEFVVRANMSALAAAVPGQGQR